MPVVLPSGAVVPVTNEQAQAFLKRKQWLRITCDSCSPSAVNGTLCHEQGCPDAWVDETRECKWCGSAFTPDDKHQTFCSEDCHFCFNN